MNLEEEGEEVGLEAMEVDEAAAQTTLGIMKKKTVKVFHVVDLRDNWTLVTMNFSTSVGERLSGLLKTSMLLQEGFVEVEDSQGPTGMEVAIQKRLQHQ